MNKELIKKALKEALISVGKDMLYFSCVTIVVLFVVHKQTPDQLKAIELFFQEKDWTIIVLFLVGVVVIAFAIQKIFKIIFKIIKNLFQIFF